MPEKGQIAILSSDLMCDAQTTGNAWRCAAPSAAECSHLRLMLWGTGATKEVQQEATASVPAGADV